MEEAKKMKCYKILMYKQFVQVSGLCGPQFQSFLRKRFAHLCSRVGDAILPPEINKNIWSSLFLFLFTRKLAYVRINISSSTWDGYTAENQEERLFQRDSISILVSRTVKIVVFSKWEWEMGNGNGNLNKDLFFVFLQPSVNKNS